MPDNILAQPPIPAPEVPSMPVHGTVAHRDSLDTVLDKERKRRNAIKAQQDAQAFKGFVRGFTCPYCHRRVAPQSNEDGSLRRYGICPHCKREGYSEQHTHYTGEGAAQTPDTARPDRAAFAEGRADSGGYLVRPNAKRCSL